MATSVSNSGNSSTTAVNPNLAFMTSADFLNNNSDTIGGGDSFLKRLVNGDAFLTAKMKAAKKHQEMEARLQHEYSMDATSGADQVRQNAEAAYSAIDAHNTDLKLTGANDPASPAKTAKVDGLVAAGRFMPTGAGSFGIRV
jgi:hypothetical protein